jgi:hypothetical protein
MPRPKGGYTNAAGAPIPGTHDPISRFMDQTALKYWAHKRGQQGLPLYDRAAIDIGSTVHGMAELDFRGRPDREIEAYAHDALVAPDHLQKCFASFQAFRNWREQCHVRAIAQEAPLVSETFQFGGTPDTIAMIGNGLGLIDFKTSPKPYPDHVLALAAYGQLWQENHPKQQLTSYHLLILPKDGAPFQHHAYTDLSQQWKLFAMYLEAYKLDKLCISLLDHDGVVVNGEPVKVARAAPEKAAKPRLRSKASTVTSTPTLTMGEMLRAYGHVKENAA